MFQVYRSALAFGHHDTPVGRLLLAGDGARLHLIAFPTGSKAGQAQPGWRRDERLFDTVRAQLDAYFAGSSTGFDLPLHVTGTPFQKSVWAALRDIPFGQTIPYAELARRIGRPTASRAVGAANGANPLPIVVPCHRVIGADGSLTGFGGGIDTKRFLLEHEGRRPA